MAEVVIEVLVDDTYAGDVYVEIERDEGQLVTSGKTSSTGTFACELDPGEYTVILTKSQKAINGGTITVVAQEEEDPEQEFQFTGTTVVVSVAPMASSCLVCGYLAVVPGYVPTVTATLRGPNRWEVITMACRAKADTGYWELWLPQRALVDLVVDGLAIGQSPTRKSFYVPELSMKIIDHIVDLKGEHEFYSTYTEGQ